MPLTLPRLPDLTVRDIRAIGKLMSQLVEATDLDVLGLELVRGAQKILPADFMLWNLWTPGMERILGCQANEDQLRRALEQRSSALNATIQHHPVIAAGHLQDAIIKPQRISDYQSHSAFRSNPLFQEVYRHVDSHHQIGFNAARLHESLIILSWNRKQQDFTDRDVQLLHLLGLYIGMLGRRIEERHHLTRAWRALATHVAPVSSLNHKPGAELFMGAADGRIVAGLIRGENRAAIAKALDWRRDTLDRHLAGLRERLGYENTAQLLNAFASLRTR